MSGMGQAIFDDGVEHGKLEMIKSMLSKSFSKEQVADVAGISLEELDEILSEEKAKD